ncbi:hypothetical protein SNEBB_006424 [Seison nebaliae]|nr:hypothetical protein SNEBB_006424 [Seison nebaliae]
MKHSHELKHSPFTGPGTLPMEHKSTTNVFARYREKMKDNPIIILLILIIFGMAISLFTISALFHIEKQDNDRYRLDRLTSTKPIITETTEHSPEITTTTLPSTTTKSIEYLMCEHCEPKYYDLRILPVIDKSEFFGIVTIFFDRRYEYRDYVTLNMKELEIYDDEISLTQCDAGLKDTNFDTMNCTVNAMEAGSEIIKNEANQILSMKLKDSFKVSGQLFRIDVVFSGKFRGLVGMYGSEYQIGNETKHVISTKFEPSDARKAFPCFDEPNKKAKFKITIGRLPEYNTRSNMEMESTVPISEIVSDELAQKMPVENLQNYVADVYNVSVPMSTYLVEMMVSQYETKTHPTDERISIYADKFHLDAGLGDFALDIAGKVLAFYENRFGIKYVLPKLDLTPIPNFFSGAMEHWGLITFRETALLFDNETATTTSKFYVARVVAHEISHMWFGNLVTMEDWQDLWLNEGFASYMQYFAVDEIFPEWHVWNSFVSSTIQRALNTDRTASSAIITPVTDLSGSTAMFNALSYQKGGSFLHMLREVMPINTFDECVNLYLNDNKFGNANYDDFLIYMSVGNSCWNATLEQVRENVNYKLFMKKLFDEITIPTFANNYLFKKHFPVLTINNDDDIIEFDQLDVFGDKHATQWYVPLICYSDNSGNGQELRYWLRNPSMSIQDVGLKKSLKCNIRSSSYQVIYYKQVKDICEGIERDIYDLKDYQNLLYDSFILAEVNNRMVHRPEKMNNYERPFAMTSVLVGNFLKKVDKDEKYFIYSTIRNQLRRLFRKTRYREAGKNLTTMYLDLLEGVYEKVPPFQVKTKEEYDNLSFLDKKLQTDITSDACLFGNEVCIEKAIELVTNNETFENILPIYRYTTFRTFFMNINKTLTTEYFQIFFKKYLTEEDAAVKEEYFAALCFMEDKYLLNTLIKLITKRTDIVSEQNVFSFLSLISSGTAIGQNLVWRYIEDNWLELVRKYGIDNRKLGNLVYDVTSTFDDYSKYFEVQKFFKSYPNAGAGKKKREQALKQISNNFIWITTYEKQLNSLTENYLNENDYLKDKCI